MSACHDSKDELLEVELAITIGVVQSDEKLAVFLADFVPQLHKDLSQVPPVNALVLILVKQVEHFNELLIVIGLFDALGHQIAKLVKVNLATLILICILDHLIDLFFSGVLTERAHDSAQLLHRYVLVVVHVEHLEDAAEVLDLLLRQVTPQDVQLLTRDAVLGFDVVRGRLLLVRPLLFLEGITARVGIYHFLL